MRSNGKIQEIQRDLKSDHVDLLEFHQPWLVNEYRYAALDIQYYQGIEDKAGELHTALTHLEGAERETAEKNFKMIQQRGEHILKSWDVGQLSELEAHQDYLHQLLKAVEARIEEINLDRRREEERREEQDLIDKNASILKALDKKAA